MKKFINLIAVLSLFAVMALSVTGCAYLDILGVGVADDTSETQKTDVEDDSGDFLKNDDVVAFFNETPGEEINNIADFLKAVINSVYVDEINLSVSSETFEDKAWKVVYSVLNDFAVKDKGIAYDKKSSKYTIGQKLAEKYVVSCFSGVSSKKAANIMAKFADNSLMAEYDSSKKIYSIQSSDPANFGASLINVRIRKKALKVKSSDVPGAELTYQLVTSDKEGTSLGKVKIVLVKAPESKFGYSIVKLSYSSKGLGKSLKPSKTAAPKADAVPTSAG